MQQSNQTSLALLANCMTLTVIVFRYVLDGYPMTKRQVDLMTERKIIPVRVIELELPEVETVTRGKRDREDPNR